MKASKAQQITDPVHCLAEGIVWDKAGERLWWVDIPRGVVFSSPFDREGLRPELHLALDGPVGAVVPNADGGILLAARHGLALLQADGTLRFGRKVLKRADQRLNDGACDPRGRFFVGTVTDGRILHEEMLFRASGSLDLDAERRDLHHANGMGWSPSGTAMYLVDSVPGTVWCARYEPATGSASAWRPAFHIDDGIPDGLHVDADGALWIAIWGAGEVRRYSSLGELLGVVEVPAPLVTSVTFAGEDMRTMVITTAQGSDREPDRGSGAGALFSVQVQVPGMPDVAWCGTSHRTPN
ncbi:SMP-30/gluconolactonase/LRE family protein [Sinomonas terrae]|uniref:SMP-30/gluconolactonase/LRE family protein n=1 Tax=Sinomonas terrae TaxID=2908838 RepID=A0ABS9U849_9MICC|nr:SMP-30/gluconolactonase/LRE family protein [Sinomonas terrae]MCH6472542.1 SMP-30/gluconolactonase/LRE family protein [Sinomonas terrae]